MTVDVEDYFHVSAFEHRVPRSQWSHMERRAAGATRRLLDVFDECDVQATFFILGWIAEREPQLVREIRARGHEIGSHSYWHRLVYTLSPEEFRRDLRRSQVVLEDLLSEPVTMYRAPSFSITAASAWAFEVLGEEGFTVDSSVFPIRHDRYGWRSAPLGIHVRNESRSTLTEFPPTVWDWGPARVPIGGGGYFRLYPRHLTATAIERTNRRGRPFMFYVHPWEVDPEQPRVRGVGWKSRARHYVNLTKTEAKLRWMLPRGRFAPVSRVLEEFRTATSSSVPVARADVQAVVSTATSGSRSEASAE